MRILRPGPREYLAGLLLCAGFLASAAMVAVVASSGVIVSSHDAAELGLTLDRSGQPLPPDTYVSADEAVQFAMHYMGRSDKPLAILHGRAARTAADKVTSVWIVVYRGGHPPAVGPVGAKPVVVDYSGVVIDDHTGLILRGFGRGH